MHESRTFRDDGTSVANVARIQQRDVHTPVMRRVGS